MSEKKAVLAIDAGGSSSRAVLFNAEWEVLANCSGGPINITQDVEAMIKDNMVNLIEEVLRISGKSIETLHLVIIGVAGWYSANWKNGKKLIRKILREKNFRGDIDIYHDSKTTWAGATTRVVPSTVIYSGTGAFSFGMDNSGRREYADIFGPRFGDSGSGYWIGLRALRRAIKSRERRGERTSLEGLLKLLFKTDDVDEIVKEIWQNGISRKKIASLVPEVSAKARDGDLVSTNIFESAARELGLSAKSVVKRLENSPRGNVKLVYSGGVFKAGDVILKPLKSFLEKELPGVELEPPEYGPLVGSILLSCEGRNLSPPERSMKGLDASLSE